MKIQILSSSIIDGATRRKRLVKLRGDCGKRNSYRGLESLSGLCFQGLAKIILVLGWFRA